MHTLDFIRLLFDPTDTIEIRPIPLVDGWRFFGRIDELAQQLDHIATLNIRGANIYFGVLPRGFDSNGNITGKAEGITSGRVVWCDIDDMRDADQLTADLKRAGLPEPTVRVCSGHGTHCYWVLDESMPTGLLSTIVGNVCAALGGDKAVKDPARVMRLPGTMNVKSQPYTLCNVTHSTGEIFTHDTFAAFMARPQAAVARSGGMIGVSVDNAQAAAYIAKMDGSGEGGRNRALFKAACVLVRDFGLSREIALDLLRGWNQDKLCPPLGDDEIERTLDSAIKSASGVVGSKVIEQPINGVPDWIEQMVLPAIAKGVELDDDDVRIDREFSRARGVYDPGPFPEKYLNVPGLIGELTDWTIENAIKRQPVLSIAAAIALQAALCARKVHDAYGIWANVYICGIGVTSCGKEFARKKNVDIMNACGMGSQLSDGAKSGSAVTNALANNPVRFYQIDEYGQWLQASIGKGSAQWLKDITRELLQLYSRPDSIYKTSDLADTTLGGKPIMGGHAIIYGTTTPDALWDSITPESIREGFVSRQIFFDTDGANPDEDDYRPTQDIPQRIIETARWWHDFDPDESTTGVDLFASRTIERTPDAQAIANAFKDRTNDEVRGYDDPIHQAVCGRRKENALKLALLYATSANPANPVIDAEAMEWGTGLGEYLGKKTLWTVDQSVSGNAFQKGAKEAMRAIRRAGDTGIARTALTKRLGLHPRDFDAIMAHLDDRGCGLVCSFQSDTGGRPKQMYKACRVD